MLLFLVLLAPAFWICALTAKVTLPVLAVVFQLLPTEVLLWLAEWAWVGLSLGALLAAAGNFLQMNEMLALKEFRNHTDFKLMVGGSLLMLISLLFMPSYTWLAPYAFALGTFFNPVTNMVRFMFDKTDTLFSTIGFLVTVWGMAFLLHLGVSTLL